MVINNEIMFPRLLCCAWKDARKNSTRIAKQLLFPEKDYPASLALIDIGSLQTKVYFTLNSYHWTFPEHSEEFCFLSWVYPSIKDQLEAAISDHKSYDRNEWKMRVHNMLLYNIKNVWFCLALLGLSGEPIFFPHPQNNEENRHLAVQVTRRLVAAAPHLIILEKQKRIIPDVIIHSIHAANPERALWYFLWGRNIAECASFTGQISKDRLDLFSLCPDPVEALNLMNGWLK